MYVGCTGGVMHETIIEMIRRNRISTTEVADALGKTGVLPRQMAVTPDLHRVGRGRAIFAANGSNYDVHEQVRHVEDREVPVVFTHECDDRAIFGDIVAKFVTLYRGAEAIVVRGLLRDAPRLRRERFPVWCEGFTPLGAVNERREPRGSAPRSTVASSCATTRASSSSPRTGSTRRW
jgi:regulator of RNase E activity RraA